MSEPTTNMLEAETTALKAQLAQLTAINTIALKLGTTLDFDVFLSELIAGIIQFVGCKRALVLVPDDQDTTLEFGASNLRLSSASKQAELENMHLTIYQPEAGSIILSWLNGKSALVKPEDISAHSSFEWLSQLVESDHFLTCPLKVQERLVGIILVDNQPDGGPIRPEQQIMLEVIAGSTGMALQNARLHRKTVLELADNMREMYILRQIDRELNDTIDLSHVFQMTLDWALRFTNAQASSLALYNEEADSLLFLVEYGYDAAQEQLAMIRMENGAGITHRVARSGYAEVVPDVSMDKDFVRLATNTRSIMAVPVLREDRVIAVITLESKKLNGFTDSHLDFVEKLATRAGVAIDNARLYEESLREREKLSHILNNTADVIIVINTDERVILINQAAVAALHLYPNESYIGWTIPDAFEHTLLPEVFKRAKTRGEDNSIQELPMPNERIFHTNLRRFEGIGWIIVMHDITPFKEMDKLKSDLIATVSHDLKQPLSVMNGYIELLQMQQTITPLGMNSVNMIRRAVTNMRQLIDDLLDLAKIESGIKLDLKPVSIQAVVQDCIDQLRPAAQNKEMALTNMVADSLPEVMGDEARLRQILINLTGNAVKYTPPQGWVKVSAERRGSMLRITVQDNGLGISPEDQMHIFDRFYRVRRPETDSIEGTGMGLAIVKSLVEAHNGQIGLESRLGEGTTFILTLPLAETT
ncbi:MAG: GAF domain-containing protein [Anaerolineae bacterium]|nr:GAF domain-containing protein [Anaerolineae bacterium]